MTIMPVVVIVPKASDESGAMGQAEEILEKSAVMPYGEGPLNENGRWESFAPGWVEYGLPYHKKTEEEAEALRIKDFDAVEFFSTKEDNDDMFIPEALVLEDGTWVDYLDVEEGVDWEEYFMEKIQALSKKTWLVFVEADV
jgi:hypothetical protein